jgi:uncharacterized membrane protein YjgN (DUF898 family)
MARTVPATARATATACGLVIVVGALLPWVGARGTRPGARMTHTSVAALFRWSYQNSSPFLLSFGAAVVLAGLLVLAGSIIGARLVVALFALVALAAAGLWIGLDATHYSNVDMPYADLRAGAWLTIGGGLAGLISGFLMRPHIWQSADRAGG